MNSFSGVVALAGEPESAVAATVEVNAGMLTLTAGGSEIGVWSLEEIEVEQTAGAFNLRADGEDLVLTTPDMTAFADAVGAGVAVAEPKREKRRRFGFRSGRAKTTDSESAAELEPAQPAVVVPPPPPPADDIQPNQFAEAATEAAIAVEPGVTTPADMPAFLTEQNLPADPEPDVTTPADMPAFLTEQDLPADPEPGFSTNPDMPAFVDDEYLPSAPISDPADHGAPTPEPSIETIPDFAGSATDESSENPPLIDAAAPPSWTDSAEAAEEMPPAAEEKESSISFAPTPPPMLESVAETTIEPPQPASAAEPTPEPAFSFAAPEPIFDTTPAVPIAEPTPEPAFDFAAPEPIFDTTPAEPIAEPADESLMAVEPVTPVAVSNDIGSAPETDLPATESWSEDSLVAPNGTPTGDAVSAVAGWDAPPVVTGRWPEPDKPAEPAVEPIPEAVASEPETHHAAPLLEETVPRHETDAEALGAAVSGPTEEPATPAGDDVSDAAGRDVPAIAGIAAVATPDRYVTVEPDEDLAARPEHGADMATQEEISAWIADVNGDAVPEEDQIGGVVPSRFDALRTRSAENYSDENVLSTPLTMAMFFTAIALVVGALLSWGIYALSDSFPVERLVSAVAAFAVAGGAYLGWRQDRRIAGSIFALGGGILALAAVYAYAREADIGIGFLLATAGAVAAVVLGIVGVTRFGHGPDPRIRD